MFDSSLSLAGDEGSLKRVGGVVRWLFMFIFLLSSDLWLLWTWLRIRNHLGFGTLEQCAPSVCIIVVRAGERGTGEGNKNKPDIVCNL